MHGFWTAAQPILRLIGGGVLPCLLLGSCLRFDQSWVFGSAASLARDQIMLVRREPPSFGYSRVVSQSQLYPDLAIFVQQHGLPDFLAETGDKDRHYYILYYLRAHAAYACRTRPRHPGATEFAGPYPITKAEYKLLDSFRQGKVR